MNAIDTFVEMQTSPNTQRAYRSDLSKWQAFLSGRDPSVELVTQFKAKLAETLAPASTARVFASCSAYHRWLGEENPFARVKAPARLKNATPVVPSDNDVAALLAAVDTSDVVGLRHRAIICLLLNGLRAQEVADLREDSLWFEPEYESWVIRVVGKGMKERLVPATAEVVEAVRLYRLEDQRRPDWLLFDWDTSQLTYRQVEHAVYKWADKAGLEGMHPHALRHHYATRLARNEVDTLYLQKLLGHARPETTERYVTLDLSDLVRAARKDPRNRDETPAVLTAVAS